MAADRGALNRSRPYKRLTRPAGPRGVAQEGHPCEGPPVLVADPEAKELLEHVEE
jgi:hypothetical protein